MLKHCLVERDRLRLTIGSRAGLGFGRGLPLLGKAIRNRAQVPDPVIDHSEGNLAVAGLALREQQNGPNPSHLNVVRRGFHAHKDGIPKTGGTRESDYREEKKEKSLESKGVDAYENHTAYIFYKHRSCHRNAWSRSLHSDDPN